MNRTQQKQLDDLVRRFSAGQTGKAEQNTPRPRDQPDAERVKLSPRVLVTLTILVVVMTYLLVAF